MGTVCSRPCSSTLTPTRKAQQFVASIHADSTLPDPVPDTPHDDHVARALFPRHPNTQHSIPVMLDCTQVTSQPHTLLLELYTSQGCQSCPAADSLLSELADSNQEVADAHVITLAFHTTVWDYLGHSDPFAQQAFRARHRAYAEVLEPLQSAYTPQLVVQGHQHLVGGNRVGVVRCVEHEATRLRRAARKDARSCTLALQVQRVGQLHVQAVVAFDVAPQQPLARQRRRSSAEEVGDAADAEQPVTAGERAVMVALVEDARLTKVLKGENRGATLRNDRIVRVASCLDVAGEGARGRVGGKLAIPEDVVGPLSVVAWLQQVHSLRVDAVVQAAVA